MRKNPAVGVREGLRKMLHEHHPIYCKRRKNDGRIRMGRSVLTPDRRQVLGIRQASADLQTLRHKRDSAVRRLHTGKISFRKGDGGDHTYLRPIQESGGGRGTHGKRRIKLRRDGARRSGRRVSAVQSPPIVRTAKVRRRACGAFRTAEYRKLIRPSGRTEFPRRTRKAREIYRRMSRAFRRQASF